MTYNSNQEAYQITTTGNTETFIPINSLDGLNNLVIEYDVYNQGNASVGFARYINSTNWYGFFHNANQIYFDYKLDGTFNESNHFSLDSTLNNRWCHIKVTVRDRTFTFEKTYNDVTYSKSFTYNSNFSINGQLGFNVAVSPTTRYLKNIVVYPL